MLVTRVNSANNKNNVKYVTVLLVQKVSLAMFTTKSSAVHGNHPTLLWIADSYRPFTTLLLEIFGFFFMMVRAKFYT